MSYRSTLQADALKLEAKKLQSSLAVEGELPEDGLAAFGDDGDDLMIALARKIVSGEEEAGSVEEVFAQARDAESAAEKLLVDEDWRPVEVEPKAVKVKRQRSPRRGRGASAVAVFLGGVHGRRASQVEATQEQASAGFGVTVRVGAGAGARGRVGLRGKPRRNTRVRMSHCGVLTHPNPYVWPFCFSA